MAQAECSPFWPSLILQLARGAGQNSITWGEDHHICAGYISWWHSDLGLNPEHPPLVKLVAPCRCRNAAPGPCPPKPLFQA
jgi:hypothetical protein